MKDSHLVAHHIRLLNGRIFQKLLSQDPEALYRSEQGKILTVLWNSETGCATATDIALATGLANNTLTSMIKNLEEQKLITISPCGVDKRKKYVVLTELGSSQKEVGHRISQKLDAIFYKGFTEEEIRQFESYQERILDNLKEKEHEV
ncbi:MarR family winged helix-turn-helix transcriptional regulator [Streptococcus sp. V913]